MSGNASKVTGFWISEYASMLVNVCWRNIKIAFCISFIWYHLALPNSLFQREELDKIIEESSEIKDTYHHYFDKTLAGGDAEKTYMELRQTLDAQANLTHQWVPVSWVYWSRVRESQSQNFDFDLLFSGFVAWTWFTRQCNRSKYLKWQIYPTGGGLSWKRFSKSRKIGFRKQVLCINAVGSQARFWGD